MRICWRTWYQPRKKQILKLGKFIALATIDSCVGIRPIAAKFMEAFGQGSGNGLILEKLDQLDRRKKQLDFELVELGGQLIQAKERSVDADRFRRVLAGFGEKFNSLGFLDRQKLLRLVVRRVDYNKAQNEVRLALYPLTGKKPAGMETPPDVSQVCHTWLPGLDSNQQPCD